MSEQSRKNLKSSEKKFLTNKTHGAIIREFAAVRNERSDEPKLSDPLPKRASVPCKLNNEKHDKHLGQFDLIKLFIECLR